MLSKYRTHQAAYANDFSILNPTIWANEAILRLSPNLVVGNLIARDFDNKVAKFGDVVNVYVPGNFTMTRKSALCENVQVQDANGTSLQVALDQWPQVAFLICDGEEDRSSFDLIENNLAPAVQALAEGIDRIVGAQVYQFMANSAGHLGNVDETNIKDYVLEAREVMNRNNAPLAGRVMLLTPGTETEALKLDTIMTADKVGDNGTALQEALLGRKYGWTFAMTQTQPEIASGQVAWTAAVNAAGGAAVGATSIIFDGAAGTAVTAGMWITIAGDDTPQQVTVVGVGTGGTPLTISPGLKRAVADNAVIRGITPGAVNNVAGYAIKYVGPIAVDGFANSAPKIGQMVTFGTSTVKYTIIKLTIINAGAGTFSIELNKPLAAALANDAVVNLGPAGKYNFGLLKNAFTLVNRPLPQPRVGVLSRVITDPVTRISLRVTISYDPVKQGHMVVIDTLIGVGTLSTDLGVVMYG